MSKELEEFYALINAIVEDSVKQLGLPYIEASVIQKVYEKLMGTERIQTIEKGLQRLKQIDNAKPSEALECLKIVENNIIYTLSDCDINDEVCQSLQYAKTKIPSIKQALLKAQEQEMVLNALKLDLEEQEKVLEIIKEKGIDIGWLRQCDTVESYNYHCEAKQLTEEEFDLLKRWQNEITRVKD